MQQSEGWVERSFSLSEEEQFSIHRQDFNVFMAAGWMTEHKTTCQTLLLSTQGGAISSPLGFSAEACNGANVYNNPDTVSK